MQYNEHQLAHLAAMVATGFAESSGLLACVADRDKARVKARDVARVSLLVARHIMAGAHNASMKEDGLELLYDEPDFL
jgi:hypothetical protein